ncbi:MAG: EpsI family protein [Aquabacterium sp.]
MANSTYLRTGVFALGMLIAVAAARVLTPTPMYTESSPPPTKLSTLMPMQFAGWREDPQQFANIVSPEVEQMLKDLYSDNLSRTYVNAQGERVMLSLAYGADQSRSLQVHKPEVCYEAQGFKISKTEKAVSTTSVGGVPVMRVHTSKGPRQEPVTYWIRSGDVIVRGWLEQNVARVKAGLKGHYPDGLLVRVSTIDEDEKHAYAVQDAFIRDLLGAMTPEGRKLMLGDDLLSNQGRQATP